MSKMKQSEAVYQAMLNITGFKGEGICHPTDEQKAQVKMVLFEGFKNGSIELKRGYATESELKGYINGLVSNWLRKDKRLNGGVKYEAKNPGSRAGGSDPTLKAMRVLLSTLTPGSADHDEVSTEIAQYVANIQSAKQAKSIDYSALPESLRTKFSK